MIEQEVQCTVVTYNGTANVSTIGLQYNYAHKFTYKLVCNVYRVQLAFAISFSILKPNYMRLRCVCVLSLFMNR